MDINKKIKDAIKKELIERFKKEQNNDSNEIKNILDFLTNISKFLINYKFKNKKYVIGLGGTGVVFKVYDTKLNKDRALKIPRPKNKEVMKSIIKEGKTLNEISHDNIIKIYDFSKDDKFPYFIMDYIENCRTIIEQIDQMIDDEKDIEDTTKWVAEQLSKIACAIKFLHDRNLIHFDIKPDNIIIKYESNVYEKDIPILLDLGMVQKINTKDAKVGFTRFYAHPDLRNKVTTASEEERAVADKTKINPYCKKYDIYAFGKTIMHILALIHDKYSCNLNKPIKFDYTFSYLHLAACRMLDGKNESKNKPISDSDKYMHYSEKWYKIEENDFEKYVLAYNNFEEICNDLKKLLSKDTIYNEIPELDPNCHDTVNCSSEGSTPLSERIKKIINSKFIKRLDKIHQLGLAMTVYPTAEHTRKPHSIGVFGNAVKYIQALYGDKYNPLFRQLMNKKDIEAALLAALLHDIGHYPLTHELEDIFKINHDKKTITFLKDFKNEFEEDLKNSWEADIEDVKAIFENEKDDKNNNKKINYFKAKILYTIINGPIDIDKADYLLRDSINCCLPYGNAVDLDRLIQNLTIVINEDSNKNKIFSLGVYEHGQAAAESLAFVRYLLYLSIYWHHTVRASKAMLQEIFKTIKNPKKFIKDIEAKTNSEEDIGDFEIIKMMLEYVNKTRYKIADNIKEMSNLFEKRNLYKRIYTIHYEREKELLEKFRNACAYYRNDFCNKLQKKICEKLILKYIDKLKEQCNTLIKGINKSDKYKDLLKKLYIIKNKNNFLNMDSIKEEKLYAKIISSIKRLNKLIKKGKKHEKLFKQTNLILVDAPDIKYGTKFDLKFVVAANKAGQNYSSGDNLGEHTSAVWNRINKELMNLIAKGRVFCHPDIRDNIGSFLQPLEISNCINTAINELEIKKKES